MPIGSFAFELGGVNSLWMGGDEDTHLDADGFCASFAGRFDSVESCDYGMSVGGGGKIDGYAVFIGWLGGTRIAIEGPIRGRQRGDNRSGVTRARFVIDLAGTASFDGNELDASASLKFSGQLDAAGVLQGFWTQRVCFENLPCEKTRFPTGRSTWTNGRWTLALEIASPTAGFSLAPGFGRRAFVFSDGSLDGVAQARFGDESICDFQIRGRYDAEKDVANLVLTPISPKCAGGSLRLRDLQVESDEDVASFLAQIQYKLFGVAGTTVVSTQRPSDYRVLLDHAHDPINALLPPVSAGSSSSGVTLISHAVPPDPLHLPSGQGASPSMVSPGAHETLANGLTVVMSSSSGSAAFAIEIVSRDARTSP